MVPPSAGPVGAEPIRRRRTWPQRLLIAFNLLLVVACLASVWGLTLVRQKLAQLPVVSAGVALAPGVDIDEPRNILIIGTDSADRLAEDDPVRRKRPRGGLLADVIMILRLDPKANTAALLSIPRDSYVPIEPYGTKAKINSAISGPNGPENLIRTIKSNFGISIENYVEIDFAGFKELVQVLSGIPIYFDRPVRDRNTGLRVEQTGCVRLDPFHALAYARSRHLQYKDERGRWVDDPSADYGRITRQQDFIQRAAQRAIDQGARNPSSALRLIDAAVGAITVDETMTVGQIRELASRFGSFNVKNLEKYRLPTTIGGNASNSYLNVSWDEAEPILDIFRNISFGTPLRPRDIQVEVGASASPLGTPAAVAAALESAGFDGDARTEASRRVPTRTVIRYGPKGRGSATVLARWIDADPTFVYDDTLPGARLRLEAGPDLRGVRSAPLEETAVTYPPGPPERSTTSTRPATSPEASPEGGSAPPGPSVTTTTAPGVLPIDDAAAESCK